MSPDFDKLGGLCAAFQNGDEQAFASLYEAMYAPMRGFALIRLAHDAYAAEDAVQDAFIEIYKGIASLDDPKAFPKWANTILARVCAKKAAKEGREALLDGEAEGMFDNVPYDEEEFLPGSILEKEQTRGLILEIMDELPDLHREALTLRYLGDMPIAEIAAALGIPEGTVKSRLNHAKRSMRERVEAWKEKGVVFGVSPVFVLSEVLREGASSFAQVGFAEVWASVAAKTGCSAILGGAAAAAEATITATAAAKTAAKEAAKEAAAETLAAEAAGATATSTTATAATATATTAATTTATAATAAATAKAAGAAMGGRILAIVLAGAVAAGGVGIGLRVQADRVRPDAAPPPARTAPAEDASSALSQGELSALEALFGDFGREEPDGGAPFGQTRPRGLTGTSTRNLAAGGALTEGENGIVYAYGCFLDAARKKEGESHPLARGGIWDFEDAALIEEVRSNIGIYELRPNKSARLLTTVDSREEWNLNYFDGQIYFSEYDAIYRLDPVSGERSELHKKQDARVRDLLILDGAAYWIQGDEIYRAALEDFVPERLYERDGLRGMSYFDGVFYLRLDGELVDIRSFDPYSGEERLLAEGLPLYWSMGNSGWSEEEGYISAEDGYLHIYGLGVAELERERTRAYSLARGGMEETAYNYAPEHRANGLRYITRRTLMYTYNGSLTWPDGTVEQYYW